MDIREFHKYNRLVRRQQVEPMKCEICGFSFILRATEDAEPVLECFTCDRQIQPGLKIYDRIVAVNKEFYV